MAILQMNNVTQSLALSLYIFFASLVLGATIANAHHSNVEYDFSEIHELQGEIIHVSWRNPHVEITILTEEADGKESVWELEAQDINSLSRSGLNGSMIHVGDIVRVAGNVSMQRVNNLSVNNLLLPNGTEIRLRGNPARRWSTEEHIGFDRITAEQARAEAGEGEGLFRVWMNTGPGGFPPQLPLTTDARTAQANWDAANDLTMQCISSGMPAAMRLSPPHPIELSMHEGNIMLRVELFDITRIIQMNSDAMASDEPASALGHSVGHWEGDTLVINTTRINWPFFDHQGIIPQSDTVQVTEQLSIGDDKNLMTYEITVTDPTTFTQPVSGSWVMGWRPDMQIEPYECIAPTG